MEQTITPTTSPLTDVTAVVARKDAVTKAMVLPFVDYTHFVSDIFRMYYQPGGELIAVGHVTPEIEIAADRAGLKPFEVFGPSPFIGDVTAAIEMVSSSKDIVYIANPNRVTGANFSLEQLQTLSQAVPKGALIVDEFYFDFYGISAAPLLEWFPNLIILRSFTAAFGITTDAGYLLANPWVITRIEEELSAKQISKTVRKTIMAALINEELVARRLTEVHEESLRLATALSGLGVQTRITAADFLMLRVNDPKEVGNCLAKAKVPIENLDGYPELQHYMRYRVQSPLSNDKFLSTFKKMPPKNYKMTTIDRRMVTLRRPSDAQTVGVVPAGNDRLRDLPTVAQLLADEEE